MSSMKSSNPDQATCRVDQHKLFAVGGGIYTCLVCQFHIDISDAHQARIESDSKINKQTWEAVLNDEPNS